VSERLHADAVEFAVRQWEQAGLPGADSLELMSSLTRVHQLMTSRMEDVLDRFDLNQSRYLLLMSLAVAPGGAYRMGTLRWLLMVHHTTVTTLVDRLAGRGLVRRAPDTTDRRSTLIVITPAGRELAERASHVVGEANFGLPALDADRRGRLVELLLEVRQLSGDLDEERARVAGRALR
jgi:DNA-binding MarR family transcriptional regulator